MKSKHTLINSISIRYYYMIRSRNIIAIIIALFLIGGTAYGETVSRKQASVVAELFFNASRGLKMASPVYAFNGRDYTTNRLFIPFYVFNHPTGGFIIVSAENKAYPILAYSERGKLEAGRLSEGQRALFALYGRQIENIRYNSETPVEAMKAWGDIKGYIATILKHQLDVTDLLFPWDEVKEEVRRFYSRADSRDLQSMNYTPLQWVSMIGDELRVSRNVVMALADRQGELLPMVATGRRADFFRLTFTGHPSDGMYRLLPTEIISQGELAVITNPIGAPDSDFEEETPFSFYDSFIEEIRREQEGNKAAIDELLHPSAPVVDWQGDGHFSVYLPENVVQAVIYNVAGMRVQEFYYRDTNMADIDISTLPAGYYIALLRGESGQTYSLRLFR